MWNNNWNHQFMFKSRTTEDVALAWHVQPYFIPHVNATVGGAMGIHAGQVVEYNFDLRGRYQSGPLDISFLTNYSWINANAKTNTGATSTGLVKQVGAYGKINTSALGDSTINTGFSRSCWCTL